MKNSKQLLDKFGVKDQRLLDRPVTRTNPTLSTTKAEQRRALAGFGLTPDGEQLPYVPVRFRKKTKSVWKPPKTRSCPNCQTSLNFKDPTGKKGKGHYIHTVECPGCHHVVTVRLSDLTELYRRVMTLHASGLSARDIIKTTDLPSDTVYLLLCGKHLACRYHSSLEDLPD